MLAGVGRELDLAGAQHRMLVAKTGPILVETVVIGITGDGVSGPGSIQRTVQLASLGRTRNRIKARPA